jgi:dienelactone hydrolase
MRIKKRTLKLLLVILILIVAALIFFGRKSNIYEMRGNKLYYSEKRPSLGYEINLINETNNLKIYRFNFFSRNFLQYKTKIYGLLFVPKAKKSPALILLPGGSITKETESELAQKIANLGYAVLTFDQRGIGETDGYYLNIDDDFNFFSKGIEPIQHLSVYDALAAYDAIKKAPGIDKSNIAIAGESMGGRYAIIAAAIEKRFKGAIIISSSGFHIKGDGTKYSDYLLSIDPDHYIADISNRKLFMLHGTNDSKIKLEDAEYTFSIAKEPKSFFEAEGCGHGYCDKMHDELARDLKELFAS